MVKIREQIVLPNGHDGCVWNVHEYGYTAHDMETGHMELVYTCES